jgi:hypothetical protein
MEPGDRTQLCAACAIGFHAPFERFNRIGVSPDGPTFLWRCERCSALWHENLRAARLVSEEEAKVLYPDAVFEPEVR